MVKKNRFPIRENASKSINRAPQKSQLVAPAVRGPAGINPDAAGAATAQAPDKPACVGHSLELADVGRQPLAVLALPEHVVEPGQERRPALRDRAVDRGMLVRERHGRGEVLVFLKHVIVGQLLVVAVVFLRGGVLGEVPRVVLARGGGRRVRVRGGGPRGVPCVGSIDLVDEAILPFLGRM